MWWNQRRRQPQCILQCVKRLSDVPPRGETDSLITRALTLQVPHEPLRHRFTCPSHLCSPPETSYISEHKIKTSPLTGLQIKSRTQQLLLLFLVCLLLCCITDHRAPCISIDCIWYLCLAWRRACVEPQMNFCRREDLFCTEGGRVGSVLMLRVVLWLQAISFFTPGSQLYHWYALLLWCVWDWWRDVNLHTLFKEPVWSPNTLIVKYDLLQA